MKRRILFVAAVAFASLSVRSAEYHYSPMDLTTVKITSSSSTIYFRTKSESSGSMFTLSADVKWTGARPKTVGHWGLNDTPIVFDFTSGGHTLQYNAETVWPGKAHVTYRGGKWITPDDFRFNGSTSAGTASERTAVFDAVNWDCARTSGTYFWGANGNDNTLVFTNGAMMTGGSAQFIYAQGKRNLLHISSGAKVVFTSADIDSGSAGTDYGQAVNRIVVTGSGSFYNPGSGYLSSGYWSAGNTMLVDDHAGAYGTRLVVGYGEFARSNTMCIANAACVTNASGMYVGYSAGATHNKLEIRDSDYRTSDASSPEQVGYQGSYNEALFENVDFKSVFRISCGIQPGANGNTVTMKGSTKIANADNNFQYALFGYGQNNEQVFDSYSDNCVNPNLVVALTDAKTDDSTVTELLRASTNNAVRIVNGSTMAIYDFDCQAACASNTVLIQDSTYCEGNSLKLWGDGNALVLSNGTVRLSQSADNLDIGHPGGNTVDVVVNKKNGFPIERNFVDRNNRLVIRGTKTKVTPTDTTKSACGNVYNGGKVELELPDEGYAASDLPLFERSGMKFHDTSSLSVTITRALQKNLTEVMTYKIADIMDIDDGFVVPAEAGWTGSKWDYFMKTINDSLPRGCKAYGTKGGAFYVEVSPARGFAIFSR